MSTYATIRDLSAVDLSSTAILVALLLQAEPGMTLVGLADTLKCSVRTVEKAIAALKPHGFASPKKTTHEDHDLDLNLEEGTAKVSTAPQTGGAVDDPLYQRLVAAGIFAGTACELLERFPKERIVRHLDKHDQRQAAKFKYKTTPAVYLWRCILQDKWPPAEPAPGLQEDRERRRAERQAELDARPDPTASTEPQATMSRDTAIATARRCLRSPIPAVRAQAQELADRYGFDLASLGSAAVD